MFTSVYCNHNLYLTCQYLQTQLLRDYQGPGDPGEAVLHRAGAAAEQGDCILLGGAGQHYTRKSCPGEVIERSRALADYCSRALADCCSRALADYCSRALADLLKPFDHSSVLCIATTTTTCYCMWQLGLIPVITVLYDVLPAVLN